MFKLYVQLVKKARQTAAGDVSLQLKRRPTDQVAAPPADISAGVSEEEGLPERDLRGPGVDADSDRTFVLHLVWGVSMLAKSAKSYDDAKEVEEMASLARKVAEGHQLDSDPLVLAKAMRAQGIANIVLGQKGGCRLLLLCFRPLNLFVQSRIPNGVQSIKFLPWSISKRQRPSTPTRPGRFTT